MVANHPFWNQPLVRRGKRDLALGEDALKHHADSLPAIPQEHNWTDRAKTAETLVIPAYRIHRTKGAGYVRLEGHMIYLGKAHTPESLQRYRQVVGEWLATGHVRGSAESNERELCATVAQVIEQYFAWARRFYVSAEGEPSPGLAPVEAAAGTLKDLYGESPAADFGPVALKAARLSMVERGLCRNVVNQRVACIKRIFRWAVGEQLVPPVVAQALGAVEPLRVGRSAARETEPVRPVPDAHVEAVLPFLPPTVAAMVRLQRLTGMRSGELCALRTCDVNAAKAVWLYRPAQHKTAYRGHERIVRLGPKAQDVLRPFLRHAVPLAYVFSPTCALLERTRMRRGESIESIVSDRAGVPITSDRYLPRTYNRALYYAMQQAARAGKLAEKNFWHPHQLRHRHATEIRQTKGLEAARVLLGHRSLSQTLEYAEADTRVAETLAQELG